MKSEKYIWNYIMEHEIPPHRIRKDTGIDVEKMNNQKNELRADELLSLCVYLGIKPEDILLSM